MAIRNYIITGTDAAGTIAGSLLTELPVIGPLIGKFAGSVLGYGLLNILALIPHETYRGQAEEGKRKGKEMLRKFILDSQEKIKSAIDKIKVTPTINQKMIPWTPINPLVAPLRDTNPLANIIPNSFTGGRDNDIPTPMVYAPKYREVNHPRMRHQFNAAIPASGGFR